MALSLDMYMVYVLKRFPLKVILFACHSSFEEFFPEFLAVFLRHYLSLVFACFVNELVFCVLCFVGFFTLLFYLFHLLCYILDWNRLSF